MRSETLLEKSAKAFKTAYKNWLYSIGDEIDLNVTGYNLQQSVELCIKHWMEVEGVKYPYTHEIETLLNLAGDCIRFSDEFYNFAPAITKWESKTRYVLNYSLTERQIITGFKLIREFLLENGLNVEDLKLPEITRREELWKDLVNESMSTGTGTSDMKSF